MSTVEEKRLSVLLAEDREEKLCSYETFKAGGENERVLQTPPWRRAAVLARESYMRHRETRRPACPS